MRIPSGVTDQYIYFVAVDATDLKTRETGLNSFTVYRSRDGAAAAAMTTPTVNETDATNMPGVYELLLDEDMTIGAGNDSEEMCFHITQASMSPVTRTIELHRPKVTAGYTLGVESDGDLTKVNLCANTTLVDTVTTLTNLPSISANWITTAGITDGAFTAAKFAASSLNGKGDWNVGKTGYSLSQSFPTNFADMSISVTTGLMDITQTGADKVWATAARILTASTNFNDISATDVNTQVSDVLKTDTISEMSQGAPTATPTFEEAVMYLYMALRNKIDVTATLKEFHNDGGTVIWKKTLSDDATTYSEAEGATGP